MMKKAYLVGFALFFLFAFSFTAQASTLNQKKEVINAIKLTEAKPVVDDPLFSPDQLLEYYQEFADHSKLEADETLDQVGTLSITDGIGKKKAKFFTGKKKLLGKGAKDTQVNLVLFYLDTDAAGNQNPVVLQEDRYEIGASRLFSGEVTFSRVGVNYLVVEVRDGKDSDYQVYQLMVEDNKTKDRLESMTLQFIK